MSTQPRHLPHDVAAEDGLFQNVLDSLTEQMAVLDADGTIVFVNEAWRRFGSPSGAPADGYLGVNYIEMCGSAQDESDPDARENCEGVERVLRGQGETFCRDYLCDTPEGVRWFEMIVKPLEKTGGAVIVRADVTARKKGEREVAYLAHHDMLTGADNWQHFYARATHILAEADAEMDALSLFYFDLDGFRGVNDAYGYAAGDELLRAVVSRLRAQSRGCDLLARFGGDEFVMLMRGVTQAQGESIAQRLREGLEESFFVSGQLVSVRSSCGAAAYPRHGATVDALLTHAEHAMLEMKRRVNAASA